MAVHICITAHVHSEVIAIAHTKGGAGKTSMSANLGYALAEAGMRVLLVDLDTQMGQTALLGERAGEVERDAGAVLTGACEPDQAVIREVHPRLDVLPADELSIAAAWHALPTPAGRHRFASFLDHARREWDVTILDTPGHQSAALRVVLERVDGVVIPVAPEAGPVAELPTVLQAIDDVAPKGIGAVFGIVKIRVWGNSVYRRVAEEQIRMIADNFGAPLFRNKVPEDARFGEAHLVGLPVGAYEPRARSSIAYRFVAYELINRRGWPFETPGWP